MAKKASEKKPEKKIIGKLKKLGKKIIGKPKVRIENVVASASVDAEFDLDKIAATLPNAEYEPEQFPGLVLRLEDPKAAILVFSSGKMVCTGAKEPRIIKHAIEKTLKQIRSAGIKVRGPAKITIQNIVASSDLGIELNLDKISFSLENTSMSLSSFLA